MHISPDLDLYTSARKPFGRPFEPIKDEIITAAINNITVTLPNVKPSLYAEYTDEISMLTMDDPDRFENCIKKYKAEVDKFMSKCKSPLIPNKEIKVRNLTKCYIKVLQADDISRALHNGLKDSTTLGLMLLTSIGANYHQCVGNLPESEDFNIALIHRLLTGK